VRRFPNLLAWAWAALVYATGCGRGADTGRAAAPTPASVGAWQDRCERDVRDAVLLPLAPWCRKLSVAEGDCNDGRPLLSSTHVEHDPQRFGFVAVTGYAGRQLPVLGIRIARADVAQPGGDAHEAWRTTAGLPMWFTRLEPGRVGDGKDHASPSDHQRRTVGGWTAEVVDDVDFVASELGDLSTRLRSSVRSAVDRCLEAAPR
jgi:hypothetical protein